MVETDPSANPALYRARLVKELASVSGPPFQVLSEVETEEASSLILSPPSEHFLYLSPDSLPHRGNPFPRVSSQDTLSSPFLPDSALRVHETPESQGSLA